MQAFSGTLGSRISKRIAFKTKGITRRPGLRRFVNRRVATSLGRFERRVRGVSVWLEDINGPRGGHDARCRMEVRLHPRGRLAVDVHAADEYDAIAKAARRARLLLDRRNKRARTRRRRWLNRNQSRKYAALLPEVQDKGVHMNSLNRNRGSVSIGSTIEIRDLHTNEIERYTLSHPREADIVRQRISSLTPMGKAVFGRSVGDTVEVEAPGGLFPVRIESIDHPAEAPALAG